MRGYAKLAFITVVIGVPLLGLLIWLQYLRVVRNPEDWPREVGIGVGIAVLTVVLVALAIAPVAVSASRSAKELRKSRSLVFVSRREPGFVRWLNSIPTAGTPPRVPLLFPVSVDQAGLVVWDTASPPRAQIELTWADVDRVSRSTMPIYGVVDVPVLSITVRASSSSATVTFVPGFGSTGGVVPMGEARIEQLAEDLNALRNPAGPGRPGASTR